MDHAYTIWFHYMQQVISLFLLGSYYLFLDNAPFVAVVALLLYVGCYQVIKILFFLMIEFRVPKFWALIWHLLIHRIRILIMHISVYKRGRVEWKWLPRIIKWIRFLTSQSECGFRIFTAWHGGIRIYMVYINYLVI